MGVSNITKLGRALKRLPGLSFGVVFGVSGSSGRVEQSVGLLIIADGVPTSDVIKAFDKAGLADTVGTNLVMMSPTQFERRVRERDRYLVAALQDPTRRIYPAEAERRLIDLLEDELGLPSS